MTKGVRVRTVEGIETILGFNPKSRPWEVLIDTAHLGKKHSPDHEITGIVNSKFSSFIDYLLWGCKLDRSKNTRPAVTSVHKRDGSLKVHVVCEPTEILEQRDNHLDGYEPNLDFRATPDTLTVTSYLKRRGSKKLEILEDFLKKYSKGNGITRPRLQVNGTGRIYVASIRQVPKVLERIQELYQRIGDKRLEELTDLKTEIKNCETTNNTYVAKFLKKLYRDRKADLLL